jgi:hypothetical protein
MKKAMLLVAMLLAGCQKDAVKVPVETTPDIKALHDAQLEKQLFSMDIEQEEKKLEKALEAAVLAEKQAKEAEAEKSEFVEVYRNVAKDKREAYNSQAERLKSLKAIEKSREK